MPEVFEESFDLKRCLDVSRRRHLHFLVPLFLGWFAVWGASWFLPPRYKSGTLILVEQPTMPTDYVVPNVNDDLQERVQSITQQILSRTRLIHIIDQLHLYAGYSQTAPDKTVERMRKDIQIEVVHDAQNNRITAFNVYYSARDPYVAQQVTSELTNLFINENVEVRQQQSEDTTKFLESQMQNSGRSLEEQEARIREFKAQHVTELPTQQTSNLQILSGLQAQLQNEQDALNTAKQQRVYLQTLIDQYGAFQGTSRTADGTPTGLPTLDEELDRLKSQIADLSSRYTDRHPDLRKLTEQLGKTEKIRDQLIADLRRKDNDSELGGSTGAHNLPDLSQNLPMVQVRGQLQGNQTEIRNREQSVASLRAKVNDYQARLNQEPVREQQLADLTRGYDQSKANYNELLKKKNQSEMATTMERLQKGEHFRILDPPSLPVTPYFPNRLELCEIGLGVGLALGVVVAGGLEMMDDCLYSEKEIKDLMPVAMISEIPEILNSSDERRSTTRTWLGWGMAALVCATILAGSAFSYLYG